MAAISTYIINLPSQCNVYASLAQACVAINLMCQPGEALIAEAFRVAFPLLVDFGGETLETALQKVLDAPTIFIPFWLTAMVLGITVQSGTL